MSVIKCAPSDSTETLVLPPLAGRLAGKTLLQQIGVLAIWPLLEQILAFCVGATDLVIAGRMASGGERVAILDAIGLASNVGWFFNVLQVAVATGVMALVSRSYGARDQQLAERTLGQSIWLGLAAGWLSFFLLRYGMGILIRWVGLNEQASLQATQYLNMFAWSGPFSGVMFGINAALRGAGDTRTPFIGMVVVNLVNIGLSLAFVFAPAPLGGHGIAGIAAGTVCGWLAGLSVVVLLVFHPMAALRWTLVGLKPHWQTMMRIARIGAPQALEIAGMWGIHAYGIRVITRLPVAGALGAHILGIRLESMSFLPGLAIGTAAATLTGQYLGAGSKAAAVKAVTLCWKIGVAIMVLMGLVVFFSGDSLVSLVAPGSEVHLKLITPLLIICALEQAPFATCIVLKMAMRGAGATLMVVGYSFLSLILFRIGILALLVHLDWISLTIVWSLFATEITCQALLFIWVYRRGHWLNAKV